VRLLKITVMYAERDLGIVVRRGLQKIAQIAEAMEALLYLPEAMPGSALGCMTVLTMTAHASFSLQMPST